MNDSTIKLKKSLLITFASLIFLFMVALMILFNMGTGFLIVEDTPQLENADIIVVLSGESDRINHGVDLYKEGLADHILLTNATDSGTTPKDATTLGAPHHSLIEETEATSTYENAIFSKNILIENNYSSAIVVTSNYHSRRTKMTFDQVYDDKIDLFYSFAPSFFNPEDGLTEREKMTTFSEYVKVIVYSIRLLFH